MKSFEYFWLKPDASLSNPIKIFHFAVEGPVTTGMVIDPKKIPKHHLLQKPSTFLQWSLHHS